MKLKIIFCILVLPIIGYAQLNCSKLLDGTFEIKNGFGNFLVEKSNNYQLESSTEFNCIYLAKLEYISECEYTLKKHMIINPGDLPMPNMNESIIIHIYKIEGNNFFIIPC